MDGFTVVAEHNRRRILDYLREAVADDLAGDAQERRGRDVGHGVVPEPGGEFGAGTHTHSELILGRPGWAPR